MTTIVSEEYKSAEHVKPNIRMKYGLPNQGLVKVIVTRNSPAKPSYQKFDVASEVQSIKKALKCLKDV